MPGVIGEKCDACPHRWVLNPDWGCHICDACHHALLDVTDSLYTELDPVIIEFQTVAGGFFTSQKLKFYDELADEINPEVQNLEPQSLNFTPLSSKIDQLELDVKSYGRQLSYANQTTKDHLISGGKLLKDSETVLANSNQAVDNILTTIYEVEKLADSFDATEETKGEAALQEANTILNEILKISINGTPVENQLVAASNFLLDIEKFSDPVLKQNAKLDHLRLAIGNFTDKLEDLANWSVKANQHSDEAERSHLINKNATVNWKYETVVNHTKETQDNIENTAMLGKQGEITLGEIYRHVISLENIDNELKEVNNLVDSELPRRDEAYAELEDIVGLANRRRDNLTASVTNSFWLDATCT